MDVSRPEEWTALGAAVANRGSPVRGLVNNAGLAWRARLGEVALADLRTVMEVNAYAALISIQELSPMMDVESSIINVGSVAATTGTTRRPTP